MKRSVAFALSLVFLAAFSVFGQQMADPNFDARVATPAYKTSGPKVLFDEAHNNFHTATGRYKPFAEIKSPTTDIRSCRTTVSATLKDYKILVISNALGAPPHQRSARRKCCIHRRRE